MKMTVIDLRNLDSDINYLKGNKIIAKFMDVKPHQINSTTWGMAKTPFWAVTGKSPEIVLEQAALNLAYHNDWNELMKVVEKIEAIEENNGRYYNFTINTSSVFIISSDMEEVVTSDAYTDRLDLLYVAVVEFILCFG